VGGTPGMIPGEGVWVGVAVLVCVAVGVIELVAVGNRIVMDAKGINVVVDVEVGVNVFVGV
jgi:hypothetical protein